MFLLLHIIFNWSNGGVLKNRWYYGNRVMGWAHFVNFHVGIACEGVLWLGRP